jgi:hypothetical protein
MFGHNCIFVHANLFFLICLYTFVCFILGHENLCVHVHLFIHIFIGMYSCVFVYMYVCLCLYYV